MTVMCPYCGRYFPNVHAVKIHFGLKHQNVNYCAICGRRFKSFDGLMKHIAYRNDVKHKALGVLLRRVNSKFIKTLREENGNSLQQFYDCIKNELCNSNKNRKLKKKCRIQCNTR